MIVKAKLMDEGAMKRTLIRMAHEIVEKNDSAEDLCILGIHSRGVPLARELAEKLDRGATFLHAEGSYSRKQTQVVLVAVKRQQMAQLKELVSRIDPGAFVILQDAHQVLGDGFSRYSKDSL